MGGKIVVVYSITGVESVTYQAFNEQDYLEAAVILGRIGSTLNMADLLISPLCKKRQINLSDRKENLN